MLSFADLLDAASGLNVTAILQDAPTARSVGQSSVIPNQVAEVAVSVMPLTENGDAPLLVSVAVRGALVWPTDTLPNLRLLGLTTAAGVTVNFFVLLVPFAAAATIADALVSTGLVVTSNVLYFTPPGTVMLDVTGSATAELLLASPTTIDPGPALHSSVALPITPLPPATLDGVSVSRIAAAIWGTLINGVLVGRRWPPSA